MRSDLSIADKPQYKREIRTSNGAEQRDRLFLKRNRVGERVRSERRARMNVIVATESPRIVRLWYVSVHIVGKECEI